MKSPWEPPRGLRTWNDDNAKENDMKTIGEYKVGIDFNPSGNVPVHQIKRTAADLIDYINNLETGEIPEVGRLKALAMTAIEEGAMWAVKAATKGPRT
jgi:hypothetical protein